MTTSVINNSVFKGFFKKQKLTGPNFIDWYRQLSIVPSVKDKLNYLEHPIPVALVLNQAGQQVAPEALAAHAAWVKGSKEIELKTLFAQQAEQELLRTMREFHSCKQKEGQSVSSYVLKMKRYIDNLDRFGYPVSLVLKHKKPQPQLAARGQNQGKRKNKLAYAPKSKITPPSKREDPAKDSICHQCGEIGHWKRNCPQYLAELLKNKKLSQGASGSGFFTIELYNFPNKSWVYDTGCGTHICNTTQGLRGSRKLKPSELSFVVLRDGIFEIDLSDSYTNVSSMYALSNKRAKSNLDSALLWHCRLGHISKKCIEKLQHDGLLNSTHLMAFEKCVLCMSGKMARKLYMHQVKRAKDLLGLIHTDNSLITQEASRSLEDLEIIQEDTHPSIGTNLNHKEDDLEIDESQSDTIPVRMSTRTRHAPDRMCLYIDAKEHGLGDLGEPTNYKAALLDLEKWLFKKKTDMDGAVHTYKAYLIAKGYTQTSWIAYEETFSPVADMRAIRILIAIAAFYDYEIWEMDVKTAFLNGYLSEEVYMEQPEGEAAYVLGIKIYRDRSQQLIGLCQSAYIEKILKRYHMENSKHEKLKVSCYTGAGYLTDADDLKSQTRYVFVLNGGVVDWKSAKKSIFTTSSAEAEYIDAYDASKEAIWVRKFIYVLGVVFTIEEPINMYCDNTGAITIANE
nr:hypothetical protein [Tanacetum cinerariifolium]